MGMQMFLKRQNSQGSGFWKKHVVPNKRERNLRKEVEINRGILRGGETAT